VKANSDYEEIDLQPKPSTTDHFVSNDEVAGSADVDEVAQQEPVYTVVKKPSQRAAPAASQVVESTSSQISEQPSEAASYQVERINEPEEESPEVCTPPRTEEMGVLMEDKSDSGSFDDAVYEMVDDTVYEIVN